MVKVTRISAGNYEVTAPRGTFRVAKDYGVGVTVRGWSAFTGSPGLWRGTRFAGETLREVVRQISEPDPTPKEKS